MTTATDYVGHAPASIGHINPDEVVTLTQIMARHGHVPANVGGWFTHDGHAGTTHRMNGVIGEVAYNHGTAYVCISGCAVLALPNSHPDYTPGAPTLWASVPLPSEIDWRYVPQQYHSRDGWRLQPQEPANAPH